MSDLCILSATELVEHYQAKSLSPVEVTRAVLDRVGSLDKRYNAFCLVDEDRALEKARESEQRWRSGQPKGLIDGVPATIKDLMLSKGWPTLRGSKTVDPDQEWHEDAPGVARMREHGAVFLGKTTTPEFGWKGVTDSPLTGSTVNPWNPERTSGGSSGGAAVAAALGMGALHLGSDGGGSIRMPAGFCGVFGIKPTFGVVPAYPSSVMGTMSHHGPMTRTVADAALMLTIMGAPDPRDWFAFNTSAADYSMGLEDGVDGLRIAYSGELGYAEVDAEVAELVDRAIEVLSDRGARVEEVNPGFASPEELMELFWSVGCALLVDDISIEQRELMDQPILELAERGRGISVLQYRKAEQQREALGRHMRLFHKQYDLLVTPQLPLTAFEAGREFPAGRDISRWWQWSPFTYPFNLTQQPAATVPCGFASDGLPVAFQIVGDKFADALVLRASRAYEVVHPFEMPRHVASWPPTVRPRQTGAIAARQRPPSAP